MTRDMPMSFSEVQQPLYLDDPAMDLGSACDYAALYRAAPLERIAMIKQGLPAADAKHILDDLSLEQGFGLRALNLSVATVNKKAKQGERLSPDESERVIGLAKLIGQLEVMVAESGDGSDFDSLAWLSRWLTNPVPALGYVCPADLIDTMEGQALVGTVLAQIQSGAYA
jgi:putative toxin-antitoxin system antitoxin component (TIGR02293 family)